MLQNTGLRLDLQILSTMDQRPYRTLTLETTGEKIELWISRGTADMGPFVKVRWVNVPTGVASQGTTICHGMRH